MQQRMDSFSFSSDSQEVKSIQREGGREGNKVSLTKPKYNFRNQSKTNLDKSKMKSRIQLLRERLKNRKKKDMDKENSMSRVESQKKWDKLLVGKKKLENKDRKMKQRQMDFVSSESESENGIKLKQNILQLKGDDQDDEDDNNDIKFINKNNNNNKDDNNNDDNSNNNNNNNNNIEQVLLKKLKSIKNNRNTISFSSDIDSQSNPSQLNKQQSDTQQDLLKIKQQQQPPQEIQENSQTNPSQSHHSQSDSQSQKQIKKKQIQRQEQIKQQDYDNKVLKISELNLSNMKNFITNPPPKGKIIQVSILRDKTGIKNKFFPQFHIFFSQNINHYICSAKRKSGNKTSNYILSLKKNDYKRKSKNCLGKLRSNFVGTEFYLYDNGENPKKKVKKEKRRQEFCYIKYEKNIMGMKGPRKLRIVIPQYIDDQYVKFQPEKQNQGLATAKKIINSEIHCFMNNPPQWNEQYEAFVLDFFNRVEQASVKNFQLIEVGDVEKNVVLQFGKIDKDIYNLDFQYPFCLLQAVSIALSSCDNKLFCE